MIPVPADCYERIEFNELEDIRYKDLFQIRICFLFKNKNKDLDKGRKNIQKSKENRNYKKSKLQFFKVRKSNVGLETIG